MIIQQVDDRSPVPKYYQVYQTVSEFIKSGEIPAGTALPPTSVLIERFGVSRITLTKAMDMLEAEGIINRHQGKGTFACETLPAKPNSIAIMNDLSLNSQRYDRQFLWQGILDGVQRTTSENGFLLNLIGPEIPLQHEDTSPSAALWNHVNGLILHPAAHVNSECVDFIEAACTRGFPVVLVDRYFEELTTDRVVFNDEEVGFILTEFLINQGHTRIAFALTNEPRATSVRNRLNGYRSALEHSGIVFDDQLILDIYSQNAVETHLRLLQEMATKKFTAVFTANDPTTEKLLFDLIRLNHDRLKEINLRVSAGETVNALSFPEIALTIAMIGDVISPYYRNYISIIARHSGYKLGQAAARLLIGRVNGKITGPPQTVIVPMEIMEFE